MATGDLGAKEALKETVRELIELTRHTQQYSAAAKAYISTFRYIWWIEDWV